ncbi:MAG: hypothetical protein HKP61_15585 [Dactylosporangium sp.]|nr:hypothetical protein [Dactylosporangium sp.]NNJ62328.1 hypothetical protein [Dactylosporangium sp.]
MPTIHDLLELSTAHLPPQLAGQLSSIPGIHACATIYGWLMWIPDTDDDAFPDQDGREVLVAIQRYAQRLGCACVLFDRDAEIIDELPRWDW